MSIPKWLLEVEMAGSSVVRRRGFLQTAAGIGAGAALSWPARMVAESEALRKRGMSCILLWMQGGPSQMETFDPKPDHPNGGETKAISTAVAGLQFSANFPELAKVANELAVIRSLNSKEGNHQRATYQMHTGYLPTASVKHPAFGALAAHQLRDAACELPAFVRVGGRGGNAGGGGFLGVEFDPFLMQSAERPPSNTALPTTANRFNRRLDLLGRLEQDFASNLAKQEVEDHRSLYKKAAEMVLSPQMKAFDLSQEPDAVRAAYGDGEFASGCLLARRLVETGVTCVEVTLGNWDTHFDGFEKVTELAGQCDRPAAALIRDLKERGMLDTTLVVWMGEFGRTPKINPRGGRDHFPRAFNALAAGAGIRGGKAIGATSKSGDDVADRPVSVNDLFRSFCLALKMNADKENMSGIGRPLKVVDGGKAIPELFS